MGDDFWKLVVPIAGALVVGVLLHLLRDGGLRRIRRRNLTEELELLALLDEGSAPAARLRRRVEVALEQYEPNSQVRRERREFWISRASLGLAMVLALVAYTLIDIDGPWMVLVASVGGAVVAVVVEAWAIRRLRLREQDRAVDAVVHAPPAAATAEAVAPTVSVTDADESAKREP